MRLLSYIFGAVGVLINFMIYRQRNRKNLLITKLLSDFAWCIHYALIFAISGACTCGISACREIVFLNQKHNWADHRIWLWVFIICNILSNFFTWNGVYSILPSCAAVVSVIVYWIGNPHITRCVQIPISLSFFVYNIFSGSYLGIVNEIMSLISIFTFKKDLFSAKK